MSIFPMQGFIVVKFLVAPLRMVWTSRRSLQIYENGNIYSANYERLSIEVAEGLRVWYGYLNFAFKHLL